MSNIVTVATYLSSSSADDQYLIKSDQDLQCWKIIVFVIYATAFEMVGF